MNQDEIERVSLELKNVIDLRCKNVEGTLEQRADSGKDVSAILGATTLDVHALMELSL